jgi:hypothetical protein
MKQAPSNNLPQPMAAPSQQSPPPLTSGGMSGPDDSLGMSEGTTLGL